MHKPAGTRGKSSPAQNESQSVSLESQSVSLESKKPWIQSPENREKIKTGLAERQAKSRQKKRRAFEQKRRIRAPLPANIIAYDLETTRIQAGTPRPLYITAYSPDMSVDGPIRDMAHLGEILITQFLTEENRGAKFVAWNGNRFDGYIIAVSLIKCQEFRIRPYMTRNHSLRGIRINRIDDSEKQKGWEFLDGISMLGLEGVTLEKFLLNFAPEFGKMVGVIDFEKEEFDPDNPKHREYAFRDSEGLWHGMNRAQEIMLENFDAPLAVTMGGVCIKIFQANIPTGVSIKALDPSCETYFREYVMRGGYCFCQRRYEGPVWKYDINQAYAAAMRETPMPCGQVIYNPNGVHPSAQTYVAEIEAWNPRNKVPFYYRTEINGRIRSSFATDHIAPTWLTSVEIEQLRSEGWDIKVSSAYQWFESFTMQAFVDRLEVLRTTCEGGPSGPIGTMVKATGNHSYGKTVEETAPIEYLIADEQPEGFEPFYGDGETDPIEHVWFRFDDDQREKEYHAVQLGAFITASVRMKVRRAALLRPASWLYTDTDCCIFDSDVTKLLDIDAKRYGAWKIEEQGTRYRVIAKKVYAEVMEDPAAKPKKRSAKGLNVKKLSDGDFAEWFDGTPPTQVQVQRNNFLSVMQSAEMYRSQTRRGTAVEKVK
jgi:hypothetical protein